MSWATKTNSAESIRYGIGVSTPEDMVLLLEKMYRGELVDTTSSKQMIDLMAKQQYNSMIPRLLPFGTIPGLRVAHKTGGVTSVRVDVGLVLSPEADFAIAVFCDQIQDRRGSAENQGVLAAARAARLVWNHFTGDTGFERPFYSAIDWNSFPAGKWARIFLHNSPFQHPSRKDGYQYQDRFFPYDPHYSDSSAVVVIPNGFTEQNNAVDLIIHFHGWNNDVLKVMEKFDMVQQLIASRKNAILIFAQGPYRASDSGGGKMEDEGGLKRFVAEVLQILKTEERIRTTAIGNIIISAHSGGYRPAILSLARGKLENHIKEVFLFDAFYALTNQLIPWLQQDPNNRLRSIYTEHLAEEHQDFMNLLNKSNLSYVEQFDPSAQITLSPTDVCHGCVIGNNFQLWLEGSILNARRETADGK